MSHQKLSPNNQFMAALLKNVLTAPFSFIIKHLIFFQMHISTRYLLLQQHVTIHVLQQQCRECGSAWVFNYKGEIAPREKSATNSPILPL